MTTQGLSYKGLGVGNLQFNCLLNCVLNSLVTSGIRMTEISEPLPFNNWFRNIFKEPFRNEL